MNNDIFNKAWKKYYKKDYFSLRECLRYKLQWARDEKIKYSISDIKNYLKNEKEKTRLAINEKIIEIINGKHYAKNGSEFSYYIIKQHEKMGVSIK